MIPNKVVPAFPYEGALYWLYAERKTDSYQGGHPYYLSLYGVNHDRIVPRASALACLFDEIVMTPADARTPNDDSLHVTRGGEYLEWNPEVRELAGELLQTSIVGPLMAQAPYFPDTESRFHFLCRTIAQIIIANKNEAVLVGNSFFSQVYSSVATHMGGILNASTSNATWTLDLDLLGIVGLDFGSADMETFTAVRQSKDISSYAKEFREAIGKAAAGSDLKSELLKLMKTALDQESIARHASGAFETIGSMANVAGLIPLVGNLASVVGIAVDASGRASKKLETKKQWYLIGPKMREIVIKDLLEKL
jgi:hypothetical protein